MGQNNRAEINEEALKPRTNWGSQMKQIRNLKVLMEAEIGSN
jgi:hypothetical protein